MTARLLSLIAFGAFVAVQVVSGRVLLDSDATPSPVPVSVDDAAWSISKLGTVYPLMVKWYKLEIVTDLQAQATLCHPSLAPHMGLMYARTLGYLGDYFCGISTAEEQLARLGYLIQQSFSKDRDIILRGQPANEVPTWVNSGEIWPAACNIDFNAKVVDTLTAHLGGQGLLCVPSSGAR